MDLFGLLHLGARSLQAQRAGVEVAGHNLANVNNPVYARQRVTLQTSTTINSTLGPQGSGVESVAIERLRNTLVDRQIENELGMGSFLEAQRNALEQAQASLGEVLDLSGSGTQSGLSKNLNRFFTALQSASASPTSLTERHLVLSAAEELATHLNITGDRLQALDKSLNESLSNDVDRANELLEGIATLNSRIGHVELSGNGTANDLRDLRQSRLEELAKLVKIDVTERPNGHLSLAIGGQNLLSETAQLDSLEVYTADDGQQRIRTRDGQTPLDLAGGSLQGIIEVRDGPLARLRNQIDTLASTLASEINAIHHTGFGLDGSTGAALFTGTDARSLRVNAELQEDPAKLQLSGATGSAGNNQIAVRLAQLAEKKLPELGNQSLSSRYNSTVSELGQALASVTSKSDDQRAVQRMLLIHRDSISGVSLDEEMSDLMKFQKAYEASARLITTVDEMLDTVLSLKR